MRMKFKLRDEDIWSIARRTKRNYNFKFRNLVFRSRVTVWMDCHGWLHWEFFTSDGDEKRYFSQYRVQPTLLCRFENRVTQKQVRADIEKRLNELWSEEKDMQLGIKIRAVLKKLGITQKELAERILFMRESTINEICRGTKKVINFEDFGAIAIALGLKDIWELINLEKD